MHVTRTTLTQNEGMAEVASEDLHGATPSPLFKEHMAAFLDGRNPTDYNPTRCANWWRFNNGEVTWNNNDYLNKWTWCVALSNLCLACRPS
jgi:hypothetical protein